MSFGICVSLATVVNLLLDARKLISNFNYFATDKKNPNTNVIYDCEFPFKKCLVRRYFMYKPCICKYLECDL